MVLSITRERGPDLPNFEEFLALGRLKMLVAVIVTIFFWS